MQRIKQIVSVLLVISFCISTLAFSSFSITADDTYEPVRSVTIVPNTDINPTFFITTEHALFQEGGPFTVTGKLKFVKGDEIEGNTIDFYGARIDAIDPVPDKYFSESTDGWVDITDGDGNPLTFEYNSGWLHFNTWYSKGTLSIADVVIRNANGIVVYDMRTDNEFWPDGTVNNPMQQRGIWYCYSYGDGTSKYTFRTDYMPMRSVTIVPNTDINPTFFITTEHALFQEGGPFTVTGKLKFVKGDEIEGNTIDFYGARIDAIDPVPDKYFSESTDGWVDITDGDGNPLTFEYNSGWLHFNTWYSKGTLSIADVVIRNANGIVVYDMRTDNEFWPDGTVNNPMQQRGIWYCYSYGDGSSKYTFKTDQSAYIPEKMFYLESRDNINPQIHYNLRKDLYGSGGPFTVSYKVKLDGLTGLNPEQTPSFKMDGADNPVSITESDKWVSVQETFGNLTDDGRLSMYLWYADADWYLADFTITNAADEVVYSIKDDPELKIESLKHGESAGDWWVWDYSGAPIEVFILPLEVQPPPDGEDVPPVVEDIIIPHDDQYNRIMGIISTEQVDPMFYMALLYDDPIFDGQNGPYTIQARVKVQNLSTESGYAYVDINYYDSGVQNLVKFYEDTDGYVKLLKSDGKPITFDTPDEDFEIVFGLKDATGEFYMADFLILDADDNVVYSFANDPTLYGVTDVKKYGVPPGLWRGKDIKTGEAESTIFVTTKMSEYIPNRYVSVAPTVGRKAAAINPVLIINTNCGLFESGKEYTIKGKIKVNLTGQIPHASEKMNSYFQGRYYGNTNGWVSITRLDGSFFTFEGQTGYVTAGLWYAFGNIALADIKVYDEDGNIVYDMFEDSKFWENQTAKSLSWDSTYPFIPAAYGANAEAYYTAYTTETFIEYDESEYGIPQFTDVVDKDPADEDEEPTDEEPADEDDEPKKPAPTGVPMIPVLPVAGLAVLSSGLVVASRKKKK